MTQQPMSMRPSIEFASAQLPPDLVRGRSVLEVGAHAAQGSVRDSVEAGMPAKYVGVDIRPGCGVDELVAVEGLLDRFGPDAFDIVVATELVEHIRDWRTAFEQMTSVLRVGGLIVLTTRSPGYPFHGSPHDYWRFDPADMARIFEGWTIVAMARDPRAPGVFAAARKTGPLRRLNGVHLYAIAVGRRTAEVSDFAVLAYLLKSPRRLAGWLLPTSVRQRVRRLLAR